MFFGVFVLVGDRRGTDVMCCDWFWMKRFCLKVRIDVVFIEKGEKKVVFRMWTEQRDSEQ